MFKRLLPILLACALLFASGSTFAHRFHAGITDIVFNERTGSTEIVHTFMTHDVEALLGELYQRQFDLSQPDDEAVLRKYVEKRFYLLAKDHTHLPLRWVGMSVNNESIIIYQEAEHTPLASTVAIHDEVLVDFLPEQINTVNWTENGALRSLTFSAKNIELGVR